MSTQVTLESSAWAGVEAGAEALLEAWLVRAGDPVTADQPLANVMLLKASYEIVSPIDGTVSKLLLEEGENFTRGQPLAEIV